MLVTINAISYAALATIAKNNPGDFVGFLVLHKKKMFKTIFHASSYANLQVQLVQSLGGTSNYFLEHMSKLCCLQKYVVVF